MADTDAKELVERLKGRIGAEFDGELLLGEDEAETLFSLIEAQAAEIARSEARRFSEVSAWRHKCSLAESALSASQEREKALRVALGAEREACARIVEEDTRSKGAKEFNYVPPWLKHARDKAAEIRARALTQEGGE
jgi:hypothetical protein